MHTPGFLFSEEPVLLSMTYEEEKNMSKSIKVQKLVYTALFIALAGALMSLEFSIPGFPPFYKLDFSDVPVVIATFGMGPACGLSAAALKIVIKLLTVGTNSMFVGELADLISAFLFVLPLYFIYSKGGKTKKSMAAAFIASIVIRTAWACFANAFISLPLYAKAYGMSVDAVVSAVGGRASITDLKSFIMIATIPFNLLKLSVIYAVTWLLAERIWKIIPSMQKKFAVAE